MDVRTSGEREPVANDEHLGLLRQGTAAWNEWRERNPDQKPDLSEAILSAVVKGATLRKADQPGADLSWANLAGVDLRAAHLAGTNLCGADLRAANLRGADLRWARLGWAVSREGQGGFNLRVTNLSGADLREADLSMSDLREAILDGTDLREAHLGGTNLSEAYLSGANFVGARLSRTIFGDADLSETIGLDGCVHAGPSTIDFLTLFRSRDLPIPFLRGCGLPENLIDYLPSLRGDALQFYSCFMSYSRKDQVFADRLHADLQDKGVRCWFAPHDLPIGAKTLDEIDAAIRLRDKLLVILSEASIASDWVEDEVSKAFAEERERNMTILFPIRIDDVVMTTSEAWARKLRDQRNIGDFRQWTEPAEYQKSLKRLLRDLKTSAKT